MIGLSGTVNITAKCDICGKIFPLFSIDVDGQKCVGHKSSGNIRRLSDGRDVCFLCHQEGPSRVFHYYVQSYAIRVSPSCEIPVSITEESPE